MSLLLLLPPPARRICLARTQAGLRDRRRARYQTDDARDTPPPPWIQDRKLHGSCSRGAASPAPTVEQGKERLLAVVKKRVEEYEFALKQQSEPNDVPTQIRISKTLKDLAPLSAMYTTHQTLLTQLHSARTLQSDPDEDIRSMADEEINSLETDLAELTEERLPGLLVPRSESSRLSALMELKPGVGGTESSLFLDTVARMYARFATLRGWKIEVLSGNHPISGSNGGGGGGGDAVFKIVGEGAFGEMKFERGVHRVQRVPITESAGRVHTSTIAVVVLPVLEESNDGSGDDLVDPKDVKTEVMRSRGAGGQHVNKTESAVRLTHLPTGISVSMQDSRSQHQNKAWAWQVLRSRLLSRKMDAEREGRRSVRLSQVRGAGRSDKIRTYNFPQDRLTDHRIGLTVTGLDNVLEGEGLEYVIHKLQEASRNDRMQALLQDGEDPGDDE